MYAEAGRQKQFEIIHYGEGQIHMKCPICGQELRPGKKDPNYLLCYNCKKKFKIPQSARKVQKKAEAPVMTETAVMPEVSETTVMPEISETTVMPEISEPEEQKYSNIPPKEVREKREQEMRDAYDELLAVGDGKKKEEPAPKHQQKEEFNDEFYDDIEEDDEKMSKAPIIILAIAIIVVAGLIAFMLLR